MPDDIKLPDIVGTLAGLPEHAQAVVVEYGKACARAALEAERARRVPLTEEQLMSCLVESGCIGTVKMTYESGPYEITRPSINASRLAHAIEAARKEVDRG